MISVEEVLGELPDYAKDIRLNLETLLAAGHSLTQAQTLGIAVASAASSQCAPLLAALAHKARTEVGDALVDDALAAATLMAMNNVYYRFRHIVEEPVYKDKPPRLRMNRLAKVATNKADFELFCLAVSAINNCQTCVQSHEKAVRTAGLSDEQVHDAIRVAATVRAVATGHTARAGLPTEDARGA
jgi:alkyl hydroperoxide reductase subunit D